MLKEKDMFLLCDFETTGVDPSIDYPIEFGGLVLDRDFNIVETINELLAPDNLEETLFNKVRDSKGREVWEWKDKYKGAYNVHKISPYELINSGIYYSDLASKLIYLEDKLKPNRLILMSDNAQFEYNFMKRVFELSILYKNDWPFHYSAWDLNILLKVITPEIGDAISVHRAFEDSTRAYRNLIRALEKLNYWDKDVYSKERP